MSIDPVTASLASDAAASAGVVGKGRTSPDPRPGSRSESAPKSKQELHSGKLNPPPAEMPRDEVQVQRTNGGSGDIVIRYMDPHGNLILQIPSSQVLGLARAIERALEEQASRESNGTASAQLSPGGTSDGH